jgi:hypothetical protein
MGSRFDGGVLEISAIAAEPDLESGARAGVASPYILGRKIPNAATIAHSDRATLVTFAGQLLKRLAYIAVHPN